MYDDNDFLDQFFSAAYYDTKQTKSQRGALDQGVTVRNRFPLRKKASVKDLLQNQNKSPVKVLKKKKKGPKKRSKVFGGIIGNDARHSIEKLNSQLEVYIQNEKNSADEAIEASNDLYYDENDPDFVDHQEVPSADDVTMFKSTPDTPSMSNSIHAVPSHNSNHNSNASSIPVSDFIPRWVSLRDSYIDQLVTMSDVLAVNPNAHHQQRATNYTLHESLSTKHRSAASKQQWIMLLSALRKISIRIVLNFQKQISIFESKSQQGPAAHMGFVGSLPMSVQQRTHQQQQHREEYDELKLYIAGMATSLDWLDQLPEATQQWLGGLRGTLNPFLSTHRIDGAIALSVKQIPVEAMGMDGVGVMDDVEGVPMELALDVDEFEQCRSLGTLIYHTYQKACQEVKGGTSTGHGYSQGLSGDGEGDVLTADMDMDTMLKLMKKKSSALRGGVHTHTSQSRCSSPTSSLPSLHANDCPRSPSPAVSGFSHDNLVHGYVDNADVVHNHKRTAPMSIDAMSVLRSKQFWWRQWELVYLNTVKTKDLINSRRRRICRKVFAIFQFNVWQNAQFSSLVHRYRARLLWMTFGSMKRYLFWCRQFNSLRTRRLRWHAKLYMNKWFQYTSAIRVNRDFKLHRRHRTLTQGFKGLRNNSILNRYLLKRQLQISSRASSYTFSETFFRNMCFRRWKEYISFSVHLNHADDCVENGFMKSAFIKWTLATWDYKPIVPLRKQMQSALSTTASLVINMSRQLNGWRIQHTGEYQQRILDGVRGSVKHMRSRLMPSLASSIHPADSPADAEVLQLKMQKELVRRRRVANALSEAKKNNHGDNTSSVNNNRLEDTKDMSVEAYMALHEYEHVEVEDDDNDSY